MFITSRESAIVPLLFPAGSQAAPAFRLAGFSSATASPSITCPRTYGVPSIYQPRKTPWRSVSPRFFGFFARFLEFSECRREDDFYMLWSSLKEALLEVESD